MYRIVVRTTANAAILLLFTLLLPAPLFPSAPTEIVRLGVLANQEREDTIKMWTPTAEYLTTQIPGFAFTIVPLDFQQIVPAVGRNEVDFVLANSAIYVELEARYGITRIATLKNQGYKGTHSSFGGVIFCRADRNDIRELGDLRGKSFAAVDETSFGGWQAAWRELKANGINPIRNFSALAFLHTHDAVVNAVRDGKFDAGTVRTDILEHLAEAGLINFADFRILNPQPQSDFPFVLSTRLYPEWPFAKVNGTPEALAKKVAVSLLNMPPDSPAARAAIIAGWTTPLVYQPVHDLMKELRIGPYRDYGKITLRAAIRMYWYWVALAALALIAMTVITGYVARLNRRLRHSREELENSRRSLELQVQERTADLEKRNEDLRREVNQRTQAELESHLAREEWELTFNSIPDLIAIIDTSYHILRVNHSLAAKLDTSPEALVGELCYVHICGAEEPPAYCPHRQAQADGREHTAELHIDHIGGDYVVTASPLKNPEGLIIGVVHVCHDITERKKSEDALRQAESRFRSLVEQSLVGIYIINGVRFLYVNPRLAEIFGYSSQDEIVASHAVTDLVAPESRDFMAETIRKRLADEANTTHVVFKGLRKNGSIMDVEAYGTRTLQDGKPVIIGTILDITDTVRAEREREEARQFLQAVIDGVNEEIMVIAPDHRVVLMNHMARDFPPPDPHCYRVSHYREEPCAGEHPCPLQTVFETKKPATVTHTHRHRSGAALQVEILASPIFDDRGEVMYVVEACRDITEKLALEALRRKMQERQFQEQKEQSITTLAGGIAHDFNNLLMGVIGNAELLTMLSPAAEKQWSRIDTIIELSKRMAHLTRQLLAYSKQGAYERTVLSLNGAISEALALTHKGPASAVEVALNFQQDLWPVFADPSQMGQLLVSLLTNAFEAMAAGGGRLTILTENIPEKAAWECSLKHHHQGGDYVHLRLTDTGHGIPVEIQSRIFDPFFTTRFMGRGLGLASALGIVQNHGGCISFESAPGHGASFDVFLPRHVAAPKDLAPRQQPQEPPARKILVVEDEPAVLALLQTLLEEIGFEPIPATSGAQALALFTPEWKNIALAILDVQMEGMDGKQLARELKTIDPDIKVLISSGYDEQTALSGLEHQYYDGFIHKPYWLNDLKVKLRSLLES